MRAFLEQYTTTIGVASFTCALISFGGPSSLLTILAPIPATALGMLALYGISQNPHLRGKRFAWAGVIIGLGWISIYLVNILGAPAAG